MADDNSLGQLLVRERLISPDQLKKAVDFQESLGGELRDIIIKLGFVRDSVLSSLMAEQQHVKSVDFDDAQIDDELMKKIPRARVEHYQILALKGDGTSLALAMADPNNLEAIEEVQFLTDHIVEPRLAPKAAVRRAISSYYQRLEGGGIVETGSGTDATKAVREAPLEALLRASLLALIDKGVLTAEELASNLRKVQ